MGAYDMVGGLGIQIKLLDGEFHFYRIGDHIHLSDGLYVGYEGWFVVKDKKVLCEGEDACDKWGNTFKIDINQNNPLLPLMTEFHEQGGTVK